MRRLLGEHPRVRPAGGADRGDDLLDRHSLLLERGRVGRPDGAERHVAVRERGPAVGVVVPVELDELPLILKQRDRRVELLLVQLVRILDPEVRLRMLQVERRVGDLDRVVRDRDLALVLRVVQRCPARRARLDLRLVVEQNVRAPLEGDAVVDAVDGVVRRRLEDRDEVLPARDQVDVHRPDVAAFDQPQARVARGGDEIPLAAAPTAAGAHERDHLVRRAGVLAMDLAAALLLELLGEARIGIVRPLDQVEGTLALPDRRGQVGGRRFRCRLAAAAAAACCRNGERSGDGGGRRPRQVALSCVTHAPSRVSIACSGLHSSRTLRPRWSSASADEVSRFCRTTTSSPPSSRSTT